ncbi:MAG: hypothetical protein K8R37_00930, partial [Bacteroidales bacterium]|nr:hypothetical protein [Bacteroidales bacterium]
MKTKIIYVFVSVLLPVFIFAQDIIVKPGTTVTLNSVTYLKLINGGNLVLKDDYSSVPSFLQKGTITFTGSGEAKVEQYLTKNVWHIVASPVNNGTIASYSWMYLYYYQESDNTWHNMNTPLTTPLNPGQGYFAWAYTNYPSYPPSPDSAVLNG